ncbi:hypothetical protein Vadar_029307 [Vaccinium darrowii]|uniref:Uncharacterized protein n=1 Tax=Vaccinium darrowii TaxID=229202 RepID=A0ACB7ZG62_9ERIC|nr:hypothetical protein Vadar_029307 [Vaccinium darrowii]
MIGWQRRTFDLDTFLCAMFAHRGLGLRRQDFKIQNIVGSCDVKFPIRLEGLAYSHGAFSSYEPELFPGLIYRMKQPKIVLLVMTENNVYLNNVDLNNLRELTGPGTQNR